MYNLNMIKGIDYIGVGVGAIIIENGKVLLMKRSQKARNQKGKWEIPGGGLEWGETFKEALHREIKEEVGVIIEIVEQFGLWDEVLKDDKQHWVAPTYLCRIKSGVPKIMEPEKCDDLGWYTLQEAEKLDLSYITKHDVASLLEKFPKGLPISL